MDLAAQSVGDDRVFGKVSVDQLEVLLLCAVRPRERVRGAVSGAQDPVMRDVSQQIDRQR